MKLAPNFDAFFKSTSKSGKKQIRMLERRRDGSFLPALNKNTEEEEQQEEEWKQLGLSSRPSVCVSSQQLSLSLIVQRP